jgi:hypothetical protein
MGLKVIYFLFHFLSVFMSAITWLRQTFPFILTCHGHCNEFFSSYTIAAYSGSDNGIICSESVGEITVTLVVQSYLDTTSLPVVTQIRRQLELVSRSCSKSLEFYLGSLVGQDEIYAWQKSLGSQCANRSNDSCRYIRDCQLMHLCHTVTGIEGRVWHLSNHKPKSPDYSNLW